MANINVRVDENVKKQASELFEELGLDMSTALNIFLREAINYGGIPFEIRRPNAATLSAMEEVRLMEKNPKKYKGYSNIDDLKAALDL